MVNVLLFEELTVQKWILLAARVCLSIIFFYSGINKVLNYGGTLETMASKGILLPNVLLPPTILIEIVGALFVLLGFKMRWAAIALIIFMVPTTLIFHTDFSNSMQVIQFMKNLAIIGGLLMLVASEPGALSVDAARHAASRSATGSSDRL